MSSAMSSMTGMVRRARNTAPTPEVSAIVWRRPYFFGISKSRSVAAWPPTWITLTAKSAPSRARRRGRAARHRRGAPGHRRGDGALDERHAWRPCPDQHDLGAGQLGEGEDVAEQVARELHAAGADERDPGHAVAILSSGAAGPFLSDSVPNHAEMSKAAPCGRACAALPVSYTHLRAHETRH